MNKQQVTVMADIEGTRLSEQEKIFIAQPELSGLIFFARNYQDPAQLTALVAEIRAVRPDFILTVDQEGGRVQRFKQGFLRLPAMAQLGYQLSQDVDLALAQAKSLGWLMAAELVAYGVDLSFAPVLDIDYQNSSVIGDRAFAGTSHEVTLLAAEFIDGMAQAGMQACGKHFPGHGHVAADSHLQLPCDDRAKAELEADWQPFAKLIDDHKLAALMPAHVIYSQVDDKNTAGFSDVWIEKILRQQLNFDGVIFSDDLSMQGAAAFGSYAKRAQCAVAAGGNVLLVCNDRQGAQQIIDEVRRQNWSLLDLSSLKAQAKYDYTNLYNSEEWKYHIAQALELLTQ